MFLILSKILPLLVYPVGSASILLVAALIVRRQRWRTALLVLALADLLIFSNRWVASGLARSLEWQYLPPDPVPEAEVIVLLGGSTRPAHFPRPFTEMNEAGDRITYAAWLYHSEKAPRILVSGGYIEWMGSRTPEAEGMLEILGWLGVPKEDVVLETVSRNTYENALYTREALGPGEHRILLVTSALHMPRSVLIYRKQGFEVIPAPVDYYVTVGDDELKESQGVQTWLYDLLPSVEHLELSTKAMREYFGIVVYRMQGWL